jgi:hypothetical protein
VSILKVSTNLHTIANMADRLSARALDLANSPLMPGGEAMVNLAHVADIGTWMRRNDLSADELANYEDPDELWSPFQTLRYWSEAWRAELNMDYFDDPKWRPTLRTETAFLANPDVLAWAWDHEIHYESFADDVALARTKLETLLREGERPDRIRVVCPDCDAGKRLIIRYGASDEGDQWKCPACKHRFDADAVRRAYAKQLRGEGAARWVTLTDALSIMRSMGAREDTAIGWVDGERVEVATDDTWRLLVWWPDMWRAHLEHRNACDQARRIAKERAHRKAYCAENHAEGCWEEGHQGQPGRRGCAGMLPETTAV